MSRMRSVVGCRVIRGNDWKWGNEDGGAGCTGTVIGVGRPGSKRSCAGTVEVCWDSGLRSNYRAGLRGKYDLRVIDTAQCGVVHASVNCVSCKEKDIRGLRYGCTICINYDLCTRCYHDGHHDLRHEFIRYDHFGGPEEKVLLTPRLNDIQIQVVGIFEGATVVKRSWDWLWDFENEGVVENCMEQSRDIFELEYCHNDFTCDFCEQVPIVGSRYNCSVCDNYDLCSDCYHNGEHHLQHIFRRFNLDVKRFPETGVELTAREEGDIHWKWTFEEEKTITYCDSCQKSSIGQHYKCARCVDRYIICKKCFIDLIINRTVKHLFVRVDNAEANVILESEVSKKDYWKWTNTDSFNGTPGLVVDIFDAGKTGRSMAFILWTDNTENDYRVGDAGRMELACVIAATGGTYYESHLPILVGDPNPDVSEYASMERFQRTLATQYGQEAVEELILTLGETKLKGDSSDASTSQDPVEDPDLRDSESLASTERCQRSLDAEPDGETVGETDTSTNQDPDCFVEDSNPNVNELLISMENYQRTLDDVFGHQKVEELILALGDTDLIDDSSEISTDQDLGGESTAGSFLNPISASRERLHELENKVKEFEEQNTCPICMEAPKDMFFQCGHGVCEDCSPSLVLCHYCRVPITGRLKIY